MFERGKRYLFMTLAFYYEAVVEESDSVFVRFKKGTVQHINNTGAMRDCLPDGKWSDAEPIPCVGALGLGHIVCWFELSEKS